MNNISYSFRYFSNLATFKNFDLNWNTRVEITEKKPGKGILVWLVQTTKIYYGESMVKL